MFNSTVLERKKEMLSVQSVFPELGSLHKKIKILNATYYLSTFELGVYILYFPFTHGGGGGGGKNDRQGFGGKNDYANGK